MNPSPLRNYRPKNQSASHYLHTPENKSSQENLGYLLTNARRRFWRISGNQKRKFRTKPTPFSAMLSVTYAFWKMLYAARLRDILQ